LTVVSSQHIDFCLVQYVHYCLVVGLDICLLVCNVVLGGVLDSPANGPAPLPWDIPVSPPEKFKNLTVYVEVPHTASVKVCSQLFMLMLML